MASNGGKYVSIDARDLGKAVASAHHVTMEPEPVRVRVILLFGDRAQVQTPWHPTHSPMWVPAADIAEQAGLPQNELPGREFWASGDEHGLTGFRLVFDPRL